MKHWTIPALFALLCSCKESSPPQTDQTVSDPIAVTPLPVEDTTPLAHYYSQLSKGEKLPLNKIITDTVTFVERDNNGDYAICYVRKGNELMSLVYSAPVEQKLIFLRGDTLEIQWKIDSIWIAGDGERLEFKEWLTNARKIKDGKVTAFRKSYTKPLKYWYGQDTDYSKEFKDYLYRLVEYYIAYSKQPLVLLHLEKPVQTDFVYSIEEREEHGRHYTVLGLSNDQGTHSTIIQWLYLDSETRVLYEYDLANDKLIPFP